jgi:hypothetical protein
MAVSCLVKYVQGASIGTPGVALIGVAGTAVTVSNGGTNPSPDPGTWTFTVLGVPSASAVPTGVVQSGSTQTWTFTPDVAGCYVVQLQVTDNTTAATSTDARAFGIYSSLGAPYLIPSFTGNSLSLNFGGQTTGWDVYMEAWLNLLATLSGGGGSNQTASFVAAAGAYYSTTGKSAGLTMTIPAPTAYGQTFGVSDSDGTASTKNITVAVPGTIQLQSPATLAFGSVGVSFVMNINGASAQWKYDGATRLFLI